MVKDAGKFAIIIPARSRSSRFPGKPLTPICGQPMIYHVWVRCCRAVGSSSVYVATDDASISQVVKGFGGQVIMTSPACLTGTDRLAEANEILDLDFVVNVQGDEPLVEPKDIRAVIESFRSHGNITNAMCAIATEDEFFSKSVPKVVTSSTGKLLYMSRAGIPGSKESKFSFGYKQVCIYAFSRDHLKFFGSFGNKTPNEDVEDIEILRFLESNYTIQMIEIPAGSLAVDFPEDVRAVEAEMKNRAGDLIHFRP